jgi:hypothetical protein
MQTKRKVWGWIYKGHDVLCPALAVLHALHSPGLCEAPQSFRRLLVGLV